MGCDPSLLFHNLTFSLMPAPPLSLLPAAKQGCRFQNRRRIYAFRVDWQNSCDTISLPVIKYTSQGVNCRTFYANFRSPPGPGPGAVTSHRPNSNLGSGARGRRARATPAAGAGERSTQREPYEAPEAASRSVSACAARTSAGCRPPRARRLRANKGERRCRAASHRRATSKARSCDSPPAQRPGRREAPPRP